MSMVYTSNIEKAKAFPHLNKELDTIHTWHLVIGNYCIEIFLQEEV
jgi:hypothetical protein